MHEKHTQMSLQRDIWRGNVLFRALHDETNRKFFLRFFQDFQAQNRSRGALQMEAQIV